MALWNFATWRYGTLERDAMEPWNVALWNHGIWRYGTLERGLMELALWNHGVQCHRTLECGAMEPWNVVFYWKVLEGVLHKVRITTSDTLTP